MIYVPSVIGSGVLPLVHSLPVIRDISSCSLPKTHSPDYIFWKAGWTIQRFHRLYIFLKVIFVEENQLFPAFLGSYTEFGSRAVIGNALCKKLCLRMFPEASSFARVIEIKNRAESMTSRMNDDSAKSACLEREHRVYASLNRVLTTSAVENCISGAICASSTDNYPEESIRNTLEPSDRVDRRASYWSSKGERNPSAMETLIYKLASNLCLITEFHVHPFQAYFQFGFPIYSAKAVRFQIGHPKAPPEVESDKRDELLDFQNFADDNFVWTYKSPEFPMAQDNCLQKFKLPEPVLCIGGILKVELLGRMQTQEMDGLYYICINHVQVVGRPLSPAFDVEMIDERGECTLKYHPESICKSSTSEVETHRFIESIRTWEQIILNTFRGAGPMIIDDNDSDYEYLD